MYFCAHVAQNSAENLVFRIFKAIFFGCHTQNFEIQVPKGIATSVCKRISIPGGARVLTLTFIYSNMSPKTLLFMK
jgi:hypothetical protein